MSKETGAIYVPSEHATARKMVQLSGVTTGDAIADLGSGDGRILIEAASRGANAHGSEINADLVAQSQDTIADTGQSSRAQVTQQSFWDEDLGKYAAITVFQSSKVMAELEEKVLRECKKGTTIVSNRWKFPNLTPVYTSGVIFVYTV